MKVTRTIGIIFAWLWLIFVFSDYLFHHPYFTQAIPNFTYWGFLIPTVLIFGGYISWKNGFKNPLKSFRLEKLQGWHGFILFWIFTWILLYTFVSKAFPSEPATTLVGRFTVKSLFLQLELAAITLASFGAGSLVLKQVKKHFNSHSYGIISIAVGFSIIGISALLQGMFFPINGIFLIVLMLVFSAFQYKEILAFAKSTLTSSLSLKEANLFKIFPLLILIMFLSAAWIDAVKLVPIGYDGLNLYGNLARNLGESGQLLGGYQPYNWSIFMSFGWLLFDNPSLGFLLSYLPGFLALAAVYRLARLWLPVTSSWLVSALFAAIPMFVFHLGSTEKVDLGFLFVQLAILLLILEPWRNNEKIKEQSASTEQGDISIVFGKMKINSDLFLWMIAGWLSGYAFGIKLTAFFFIFSLLTFLFYKYGNLLSWLASVFCGLGILYFFNIQTLGGSAPANLPMKLVALAYFVGGLIGFWAHFRKRRENIKPIAQKIVVYSFCAFLSFAPWLLKNAMTADSVSVESLISGKTNSPEIKIPPEYVPANLRKPDEAGNINPALLLAGLVFQPSSVREELERYIGYTDGFVKYLSLFYKQTMNTEIKGKIYVNIGLIFFLFLPFYLFFGRKYNNEKINRIRWISSGVLLIWIVSLSVYVGWADEGEINSVLAKQTVEHPSGIQWFFKSIHVPLTMVLFKIGSWFKGAPILFGNTPVILIVLFGTIFAGIWFLLSMPVARQFPRTYRAIGGFSLGYVLLWFWLGNGVPWYGFTALPLLLILAVMLFYKKEKPWNAFFQTAVTLWLILSVFNRFTSIDKTQMQNSDIVFNYPTTAYSTGQVTTEKAVLEGISGTYAAGANAVNRDRNGKVYRVGSFIHYFIENNATRVFEDNQLGQFQAITASLLPGYDFTDVLKANGFKYILFNPNDIYFDQTPEQSFRKKFEDFWRVLASSNKVRVISTNNVVSDPSGNVNVNQANGSVVRGRYDIKGTVLKYGDLAVLEIL